MGVINRRFIPSVKIDKALQRIHSDEWCSWQPSLMIQYQTVQRNCTWTRNICNVRAKLWWIIFSTQKYQPFLPIRQYYSENCAESYTSVCICGHVAMPHCGIRFTMKIIQMFRSCADADARFLLTHQSPSANSFSRFYFSMTF